MKLIGLSLSVLLAGWVAVAQAQDDAVSPEGATGRTGAKGGRAKSYMVVAANPIAAQVGAQILKSGGSAVDAAIAVQLVLNEVEPQSSGIGGGAFMIHWDKKAQALTTFDGRETAPAAATEKRFLEDNKPMGHMTAVVGGLSVGVPGVLRMLEMAHKKHGKLPWAKLFDPAIRIAEEGFEISPRLYGLLSGDQALRKIEPAKSYFYLPDGTAKPVGTRLKNPEFAKTLRAIAKGGADAFYRGPIADDIVRTVTAAPIHPGDITRADIENYRAIERPAVCGPYRGYKICGMGPPTDGGIGIIQAMGMLERFDLAHLGPQSATAYHLVLEANRLVFADRAVYLADPEVVPVPTEGLISRAYIDQRSGLISAERSLGDVQAGTLPIRKAMNLVPAPSPELPSTSHFSIVDHNGNAVGMTTSVENSFGSRLMVDGFLLDNTLTDFSYGDVARGETVANRVGPNKRPRSSMAPTMVFGANGKLEMVLGSPGGPAIVPFVVKTLVAMIDWKMSPADAAALPYAVSFGRAVSIEPPISSMKPALEALGHQVRIGEFPSGMHAIRITRDAILGGADPRREGVAVGQ